MVEVLNDYLRVEANDYVVLSVEFLLTQCHRGIVQSLQCLWLFTLIEYLKNF